MISSSLGPSNHSDISGETGAFRAAILFITSTFCGVAAHLVNTFVAVCTQSECPFHQLIGDLLNYTRITPIGIKYIGDIGMVGEQVHNS